jgi:methyltransferase (TIGR00027 family)
MENKRRIEKKSSRTASYTCMCRAASYLEKNSYFKSDDYIAVELLPKFIKFLIRFNILNLKGRISPKGIYQYVIARTKYIDSVFQQAIKNGIDQVFILGAGFDSRGIRFSGSNNNIKVYEIDTYYTRKAKIKQYKKRKIQKPENNIFISVDFEKEDIRTRLTENKFDGNKKTLFILEGLTMYLSQKSVEDTFELIRDYSEPDSLLVFDYIYASVLRKENKYYGENEIYQRVKKDYEKWTFGIEEEGIKNFLENYNFSVVEHLDSNAIEKKYFKDESGRIITKVNGTHCIVSAKRNDK